MGRNAAFGRASLTERVRTWWGERDRTARQNVLLAVGVGVLFVAIILAAVNRDKSPTSSRVISSRPQATTTTLGFTPSTVFVGNLGGDGTSTAADLSATSTTSPVSIPAPAPARSVPPTTRPAPATATTVAPAPVTTVTNPGVIFTDVPPETTTTTRPPATTTTRAPTTTIPPTTTTTALALPVSLPGLLAP